MQDNGEDPPVRRPAEVRPGWVSREVDVAVPSAARVYDYYLGGSHNLPVDRAMAREAIALWPALPQIMQANRGFLRRAVRYLLAQGITQFLDIGSGIPTVGNVHEVVRRALPEGRVVYVDIDPVAVAHSRVILSDEPHTAVVQADLRDVDSVLDDRALRDLLDLSQPVGVLMVAVLHFVTDADDPVGIVGRYRDAMAPGSHLVISHATGDGQPQRAGSHVALYRRSGTPMTMRSRAAVAGMFDGFDLVPPGAVFLPQWRPDPEVGGGEPAELRAGVAAVGRRR